MTTRTGTVEAVTNKFGKFNVLLDDGQWYSTKMEWKPSFDVNKGDIISFDAGPTGKYLSKVKKTGSGAPTSPAPSSSGGVQRAPSGRTFPVGALAPERTINRQNALTNAVNYCDSEASPEEIVDIARIFEAYTTGDLDAAEAEAAMAEIEGRG